MLSTPDLVIIGLYIFAMTLFGVWFARKQKDLRSYFVGNRDVGWFLVLISIVATETSTVTFLSVPGMSYKPDGGNMTFLQLTFGYIIGRMLVSWLLLPLYMRGELFSAYQVLQQKFGPGVQRVASALFLVTRTLADGLRLYLTALVVQYLGWTIPEAIIATGIVTIIYTYLGGMKAVLWTDLLQFSVLLTGAGLALYYVIALIPGGWDTFVSAGDAAGKFQWLDTTWDPTQPFNLWAGLIGGAVLTMATHGADQLMVQRYLCAKSLGQARFALVLSGFTVCAQFALFLLVGIGFYVAMTTGVFDTTRVVDGVARTAASDEVFSHFIVTKMRVPVGVVGVLVAAILAAAMSTLASSLNSSANAFVTDFYKPMARPKSERFYVNLSRVMTAFWGVMQIGVALAAHYVGSERSVVDRVLAVAGFTTGLILGLFILGRMRTPVSSRAAIIGLVTGFIAVLGVWLPGQLPEGEPILAWPWFPLVGSATTVIVALLANSFLTPGGTNEIVPDRAPSDRN